MLTNPSWPDIVLRLVLAAAAGVAVGYNREARSQAAGLRTTTLVCLAACLSMVLANLLLGTSGKGDKSFVQLDMMRLPLGILSGMGFLGAGAIIRRGDAVVGVTTAATLWFMTMVGLTFGAGQLWLGAAVSVGVLLMLWILKAADRRMRRNFRGALIIRAEAEALDEAELRRMISDQRQRIVAWGVTYEDGGARYEARAQLEWRGRNDDRGKPPAFVQDLARRVGVSKAQWDPEAISA